MRNCASAFLLSILAGCQNHPPIKTILPAPAPQEQQASFDGEQQNSGIIDYIPSVGYIITKNAKERYQSLVAIYGSSSLPLVLADSGISKYKKTDKFVMSSEAMTNFAIFSEKSKSGR